MTIPRSELMEGIAEHYAEIKHGKRTISSRFPSRCTICGNLFMGPSGAPCPRSPRYCSGTLESNPKFQP